MDMFLSMYIFDKKRDTKWANLRVIFSNLITKYYSVVKRQKTMSSQLSGLGMTSESLEQKMKKENSAYKL